MPSTNTITAFYTFVAGTRARAAQVNANFDNFRGHLLPINTDTATASHQTHNLGSADHQWNRIYLKEPPVIGGAGTPKFEVQCLYDGSHPTEIIDENNWLSRVAFHADDTTGVAFQFVVPTDYVAGTQIKLNLRGYCETATAHFAMESGAALYKHSLTSMALTAPANMFTSTANIQPPVAGLMFTDSSLNITTAGGTINGVTVGAGDVISCYLNRTPNATGDTNSGYFFLTNVLIDLNN